MAKQQDTQKPVIMNFRDVDAEAAVRAQSALQSGQNTPLKVPAGVKSTIDKKGTERWRWTEQATVVEAYRSTTKKGLMDATIILKIRQSENAGNRVYGHFYMNMSVPVPDNHEFMNDKSLGAIQSALVAVALIKPGQAVRGSILDKMFPPKGQPGTQSPLNDKAVVVNVMQALEATKDQKTGKALKDDEGEPILERRDYAESFLPETGEVVADEEDDEDDEDEVDETEEDETDEDAEEDEEEAVAVAPAPKAAVKVRRK